jgi:hypothetical protein
MQPSPPCNPITLVKDQDQASAIAVNSSMLFWTRDMNGSVWTARLDGQNPSMIATADQSQHITADESAVYWTEVGSGLVRFAKMPSGAPQTLDNQGGGGPSGIAVDGANVFWLASSGAVRSASTKGGTTRELCTNCMKDRGEIVVHDQTGFYTNNGMGLRHVQLAGGPSTAFDTPSVCPGTYVTANATGVFFNGGDCAATSGVYSCPFAGCAGQIKRLAVDDSPNRIAVDDEYVYWTSNVASAGTVKRAPVGGGPTVTLATGQANPTGITVDRDAVYWADNGNGTIMKVDRCCGL